MPRLPASNNQGPRLQTSNNKGVQKIAAKHLPSYYGATKVPNDSDFLLFGLLIVGIRSYESKRTTKNKTSPTTIANVATKKQNNSDPLILAASTKSIQSCESKYANTENDDNKQDGTLSYIYAIGRQCLQKNRKFVIKSDSDESERDEMSHISDKNTKEKELGTFNSSIKVHIPCSSILLNSSVVNSTK